MPGFELAAEMHRDAKSGDRSAWEHPEARKGWLRVEHVKGQQPVSFDRGAMPFQRIECDPLQIEKAQVRGMVALKQVVQAELPNDEAVDVPLQDVAPGKPVTFRTASAFRRRSA